MAGQARVLRVITGCGSPAIIAALACPAPAGPIDAGGVLEADQVLAVLLAGALEAGNPEAKARATIKSGLAAGSDAGNGRARYWSPTTPNLDATAPATANRTMVGERAWHDLPGSVLDPGLAESRPWNLAGRVVTDLRTAPRKKRPHERGASPREPGGRSAMLEEWST
jgi:hypothetical protein